MEGNEVGKPWNLNDAVFGVEINEHLSTHGSPKQQLANKRQGTQKAKTVLEVRGGGRNLGDRKELVTQDRVQHVLLSGQAAELYSLQYQEITLSN